MIRARALSEQLQADARSKTGLSDFGRAGFQDGLEHILEDTLRSPHLKENKIGPFLLGKLENRLLIRESLRLHPEILDVPIKNPLVVVGLHRSGTTYLHRLLAHDPNARAFQLWELRKPAPPPEQATRDNDPRIQAFAHVDKDVLQPLRNMHATDPREVEEDRFLLLNTFVTPDFLLDFDLPTYFEWICAHDMRLPYQEYREQVQLLLWRCPGDPVQLKNPNHLWHLPVFLENLPGAKMIHLHRDPAEVFASYASWVYAFRALSYDPVRPEEIGKWVQEYLTTMLERCLRARDAAGQGQFLDVLYQDLVADPVGTVKKTYEHFGYPFSEEFGRRLNDYVAKNPQHKHGKHVYALSDYGINEAALQERLHGYVERFGIPIRRTA